MKVWDKISQLSIENPHRFKSCFQNIVQQIQEDIFDLTVREKKEKEFFLIVENNRLNSYFVHIVPFEAYDLLKEIARTAPQQFLGFSIFIKKYEDKDIRVSCFGIPCSLLTNFLKK